MSENKKVSALDLLGASRAKTEAAKAAEQPRAVVTQVSGALLSQKRQRKPETAREGCAFKTIRNLPITCKERFDNVVAGGLFRESYNQYILDAIEEKLSRDEKALAKKAQ